MSTNRTLALLAIFCFASLKACGAGASFAFAATGAALPAGSLENASSLYLRDAAGSAIKWQPWNAAAFSLARRLNRPVLIDIGAAWCHWCHVMDNTTYADPAVIREINAAFVPIKVDTDERPDIDAYYQAAAAQLVGAGGWPLTCFTTPDGALMYATGYLPARASGKGGDGNDAVSAMLPLLLRVASAWSDDRRELETQANSLASSLANQALRPRAPNEGEPALLARILAGLKASYDPQIGGFGSAQGPRFYDFPALRLALASGFHGHREYRTIALETLDKIARGGVFDQLGGGFHRYSTDPYWRVPHFEKMSYDQAMALTAYSEAYEETGDQQCRAVIERVISYVDGTLIDPDLHAFYPYQSADSFKGDDGSYYTWTKDEIATALSGKERRAAILFYGIDSDAPRAPDGRIVLAQALSTSELAAQMKINSASAARLLAAADHDLLEARDKRAAPPVDHEIMTDRNALMASAYFTACAATGDPRADQLGYAALDFILAHMRADDGADDRGYYHAWSHGKPSVAGIAADQVYLMAALLDAYQAGGNPKYLDKARALADLIASKYLNSASGLIVNLSAEPPGSVIAPSGAQVLYDDPMPSVQAQAAIAMRTLGAIIDDEKYARLADRLLAPAADLVGDLDDSTLGALGLALEEKAAGSTTVAIVGRADDRRTKSLLMAARAAYRPGKIIVRVDPSASAIQKMPQAARAMYAASENRGVPLAFVCAGTACARPAQDSRALAQTIASFMTTARANADTAARLPGRPAPR